ncbi:Protein BREVIS RADIX [Hibiscus syriacus]|uniref:Protein BREVIS RADIX n=1 Tax=Hibiscus syriacus TaxID=106335 RepID=A0A6A2ZPX3_HIBSY|nr:Protein BREVIS RADIX [Hibiscus syriacus]
MFTCIACTKQTEDGGEEEEGARGSGTPSTKEAVKSLTTQFRFEYTALFTVVQGYGTTALQVVADKYILSVQTVRPTVLTALEFSQFDLSFSFFGVESMQIKDMALKFSGAYKQCKPCTGSSSYKTGSRPYPDFDAASEGIPYPYMGGSSSSTPAWDFTSASHRPGRSDSRFTGAFSGERTSVYRESFSVQDLVLEDEDEPKEWMAQVEPGVHITFVSLPNGGNDLKRIRFSREMFDKWQAQRWWGENYDRIMELYNVERFNRQALHTPPRSEDETQRDSSYSRVGSAMESPMPHWTPRNNYRPYSAGPSGFCPGGTRGDLRLMLHERRPRREMSLLFRSAMPVKWRPNGLKKMNPGFILPSDSWLMAPGTPTCQVQPRKIWRSKCKAVVGGEQR